MNNKKLKFIVIMFLVGLAGVIYFGYNTSGYTSEKEKTDIIFNGATIDDSSSNTSTDKPSKNGSKEPLGGTATEDLIELYEVYLCGCVKKPGVYTLEAGSRLYEYLELAGGYTPDADTEYENLARTLSDGEKVYFPSRSQVSSGEYKENITSNNKDFNNTDDNTSSNKVNINTAGIDELTTLAGIGESRAKSIIDYRQANGEFKAVEDIMLVNGIKESVYEKIKEYITV